MYILSIAEGRKFIRIIIYRANHQVDAFPDFIFDVAATLSSYSAPSPVVGGWSKMLENVHAEEG